MLITSDYPTDLARFADVLPPLSAAATDRKLEILGVRAEGVISRVIAQRFRAGRIGGLRSEERDDLRSTAILRVMQRLRGGEDTAGDSIADFDAYVAMVTLHAFDDLLRERMPLRTSAKNRVRYVIGHDRRFRQWNVGPETVCGLQEWVGAQEFSGYVAVDAVRHIAGDRDVVRTLSAILAAAGRPVELDALVNCAAELWEMIDRPTAAIDDQQHAAPSAEPVRHLENRQFLARLWKEIRDLNRPQRVALLLNLRDEHGPATELLPMLGVASVAEIAETVELSPDEFAPLWRELPLEDLRIAGILGITRQQVINLRKSARERLVRRMRY